MAVTIELRFPWGRVHATPWERSANEGEPEWPPAPWRLLRALYSVWRFRCPTLDEVVVERLLRSLAPAPAFRLPPHQVAHTRHYFPDASHRRGDSGRTDKVFDTFAVIPPDEPVMVRWADAELDADTRAVLAVLLAELPFLGRAESLCDGSIRGGPDPVDGWIEPLVGMTPGGQREVAVLVPDDPLVIDQLLATTRDVRSKGFIDPPGAHRVSYGLAAEPTGRPLPRRRRQAKPTLAVLAVLAAHGSVLPNVKASLAMCELLRMAVQERFGHLRNGAASSTFSGKDLDGGRRLDQHLHAHYLALPQASDERFIDRFVVWSPEGLDLDEVRAITSLRTLRPGRRAEVEGGRDLRSVHVRLETMGRTEMLSDALTGPASRWRSQTPFITSRNLNNATRRRLGEAEDPWSAFLIEEVQREARLRGLPTVHVRPRRPPNGLSWLSFRRHRAFKPGKLALAPRGGGFDLTFAEPVKGPIALGAQSHYGLGLFVPDRSEP